MTLTNASIRPLIRAFAAFLLITAMFRPQAFTRRSEGLLISLNQAVKKR